MSVDYRHPQFEPLHQLSTIVKIHSSRVKNEAMKAHLSLTFVAYL